MAWDKDDVNAFLGCLVYPILGLLLLVMLLRGGVS